MSYSDMKTKAKNDFRENIYYNQLLISLCNMFKWQCPEDVDKKYIEQYLHEFGSFAVQKQGNVNVIIPQPCRSAPLNMYGDGIRIDGVCVSGIYTITDGKYNKDVAICYNNIQRMPDYDIMRYADYLSNVDKSLESTIAWSMVAPLLCAKDDKTRKAIELILARIMSGELQCITSSDIFDSLKTAGLNNKDVYTVDITNPERIKNAQYLSGLYDVLIRRFYNKYGLNIQNSSKQAQATVDEIHGLDSVSWVLPLDMLHSRQKFCTEINAITNDNWSVNFNDIWLDEYNKYLAMSQEKEQEEDPKPNEDEGINSPAQEEKEDPKEQTETPVTE